MQNPEATPDAPVTRRGVETYRHPWRNLLVGVLIALAGMVAATIVARRSGDAALQGALARAESAGLTDPVPLAGSLEGITDTQDASIWAEKVRQVYYGGGFDSGVTSKGAIDSFREQLRTGRLAYPAELGNRAADLVRSKQDHHYAALVAFHEYLVAPDRNDGHIGGLLDSLRLVQVLSSGRLVETLIACSLFEDTAEAYERSLRVFASRGTGITTAEDAELRRLFADIDLLGACRLAVLREPLFSPEMMELAVQGARSWDSGTLDTLTGTAQKECADLIDACLAIRAAVAQDDINDVIRDLDAIEQSLRTDGSGILGDVRLQFSQALRTGQASEARWKALKPLTPPKR